MSLGFQLAKNPVPSFSILKQLPKSSIIHVRTMIKVPIKWQRPEKIPWTDRKQTGDGTLKLDYDMSAKPFILEESKEIQTASEEVQKLFSFHFLGRKFATHQALEVMVDSVKNHKYDRDSFAAKVAAQTAIVRNLLEHLSIVERDVGTTIYAKEIIERRNKNLKYLRKYDYKQFEWILEKLDLYYKPRPEVYDRVEKRKSIRKLTDLYCENYKKQKLEAYKQFLLSQRESFLRDKIEILQFLRKEEIACEVEPTISENDIEVAKQKLEEYLDSLPKGSKKVVANILMEG